MKKKYIIFTLLLGIMIMPSIVHAEDFTNSNGVVISEEQYNNYLKLYSEDYINVMTQEEVQNVESMNIDYDNIDTEIKYIKTVYNNLTGESSEEEITEEEYNSVNPDVMPISTFYETAYKSMALSSTKLSQYSVYATFLARWKIMPANRSYDVIGFRLNNLSRINGTQNGKQYYTKNGVQSYVNYRFDGNNINNQWNGFGISMNLVNDTVSELECHIDGQFTLNGYPYGIFASYQHATSSVSLANSKNYTLTAGGLGSVFNFASSSVANKYDSTQGLELIYTS